MKTGKEAALHRRAWRLIMLGMIVVCAGILGMPLTGAIAPYASEWAVLPSIGVMLAGLVLLGAGLHVRRRAQEEAEKARLLEAAPSTCPKCGGPVEYRARPLGLGGLLAIISLIALGLSCSLTLPKPSGAPLPVFLVIVLQLGLQPVMLGVKQSSRYRMTARCTNCWDPQWTSEKPPMGFIVYYLASVILMFGFLIVIYLLESPSVPA